MQRNLLSNYLNIRKQHQAIHKLSFYIRFYFRPFHDVFYPAPLLRRDHFCGSLLCAVLRRSG